MTSTNELTFPANTVRPADTLARRIRGLPRRREREPAKAHGSARPGDVQPFRISLSGLLHAGPLDPDGVQMAIHVNGASMRAVGPHRVLVTSGSGIPVERAAPEPAERAAVIVDASAAQALGHAPTHDLKSGLGTVWPQFSEAAK
jgi:hypothetical protein